jgi:hypothetical protein
MKELKIESMPAPHFTPHPSRLDPASPLNAPRGSFAGKLLGIVDQFSLSSAFCTVSKLAALCSGLRR